jgi:CRISPR system Cascade subunit CasB
MPPDQDPERPNLNDTIYAIGRTLAELDPGPLAELRRMSLEGDAAGAPYFWRLAARHDFGSGERLLTWARIVQLMAILTDKGTAEGKRSPHDTARGFGSALCDGGDPGWGIGTTKPRPMLSELRFARLLAAKGPMRLDLMDRAVRALGASKPPGAGVNCNDLAWFLLDPDNPAHARKLARNYYARLDPASRPDTDTTKTTGATV